MLLTAGGTRVGEPQNQLSPLMVADDGSVTAGRQLHACLHVSSVSDAMQVIATPSDLILSLLLCSESM